MKKVYIDFETKSSVDINAGLFNYLKAEDADIICCGYKIENGKIRLWRPRERLPDCFMDPNSYRVYAYNIQFDRRVWNIIGRTKYNFGFLPLANCVDIMAICGRYTFPQSLEKAGDVLQTNTRKDKYGNSLIKKICIPPYQYTDQEMRDFLNYCIDDVQVLYELSQALPLDYLAPNEQRIWELTAEINERGVPIDTKAVEAILKLTTAYQQEHAERIPSMTDGMVTKITQVQRIRQYCETQGVILSNLTAETVEKTLKREDIPGEVREILEMRQELGKSSVAKYKKIQSMIYEGRIYDNLRYYGASTGRWAGMGFQLHNLPRAKVKKPNETIEKFYDLTILEENPIAAAKALIRPMICTKDDKETLLAVADYSSIEYIILIWLCQNWDAVNRFYLGFDQYIDMATFLYQKEYEEIDKDERHMGKIIILGCGYGLGWKGFQGTAESWGLKLPEKTCMKAVNAFRDKYNQIPAMWYKCKDKMVQAIEHAGYEFEYKNCKFKVIHDGKRSTNWLRLTLPSGRALFYNEPELRDDKYGKLPTAMGINPYSKKWQRLKIIPGRIVENIVQALARDVLAYGKLCVNEHYPVIGSVHDEIIVEVSAAAVEWGEFTLEKFYKLMCKTEPWADTLPVKAEGYIGRRYKKF